MAKVMNLQNSSMGDKSLKSLLLAQGKIDFVRRTTIDNGRSYASSGGDCARKNVLTNSPNILPDDLKTSQGSLTLNLYGAIGESAHTFIQKLCKNAGILLFGEYKLPNVLGINVGGRLDGFILFQNRLRLLEIKTCGSLPFSIKPEHKNQSIFYSAITGLQPYIFYVARNVMTFQEPWLVSEFDMTVTEQQKRDILTHYVYSDLAYKSGKIPKRPFYTSTAPACKYCIFKSLCWSDNLAELELSEQENGDILKQAEKIAEKIYDNTTARRNGILKHVERFGYQPVSEKVLHNTSWSDLI